MNIEEFRTDRPDSGSLLITDEASGIAVVIDPTEEIAAYLRTSKERGLRLAHVFLTHLPDDERQRNFELWQRLGVQVHASSRISRRLRLQPLLDGSRLRFGDLGLEFHHAGDRARDALRISLFDLGGGTPRPVGFVTRSDRLVA